MQVRRIQARTNRNPLATAKGFPVASLRMFTVSIVRTQTLESSYKDRREVKAFVATVPVLVSVMPVPRALRKELAGGPDPPVVEYRIIIRRSRNYSTCDTSRLNSQPE